MAFKRIESLQHPLVKHLLELRTDRKSREEAKRVLILGEKMARELPIEMLLTTEPVGDIHCKEKYLVTDQILKKITGLSQSDGFVAVAQMPQPQDLSQKRFLLVLDEISDPGNLGTLIRTALALNWEGVVLTPGTVDLFNDKAMRAAKGATFHLPYTRVSSEELSQWKTHFYTADLKGEPLGQVSFTPPIALVLSNEARGPASWAKTCRKITIPMSRSVDSLNVATSGAILLYEMRPR